MLFPAGLFFVLIPFLKSREKALVERPGGEGCIITANYSCVRTYSVPATAVVENQQTLLLLLFLTAEQYTLCICWYFATIFILFLIYIQPKEKKGNISSFCFIKQSTNRNACLLITLSVWSNEDMLWDCLFRIHRYGSKSLHIDYWRISLKLYLHKCRKKCMTENPNIYFFPCLHKKIGNKCVCFPPNEKNTKITNH